MEDRPDKSWVPCVLWLDWLVLIEHETPQQYLLQSDTLSRIWEIILISSMFAHQFFSQQRH